MGHDQGLRIQHEPSKRDLLHMSGIGMQIEFVFCRDESKNLDHDCVRKIKSLIPKQILLVLWDINISQTTTNTL